MKIKLLVDNPRLSEMVGLLLLLLAVATFLALISYSPVDPSANVATDSERATNWMGLPGAFLADLILQSVGLVGFLVPVAIAAMAVNRIRNSTPEHMLRRFAGGLLLALVCCGAFGMLGGMIDSWLPGSWGGSIWAGGALGKVAAEISTDLLNIGGTVLLLLALTFVGFYMLTSLQLSDILGRSAAEEHKEPPAEAGPTPDQEPQEEMSRATPKPSQLDESPAPVRDTAGTSGESEGTAGLDDEDEEPFIVPYEGPKGELTLDERLVETTQRLQTLGAKTVERLAKSAEPSYVLPRTSLLNPPYSRASYDKAQLQVTSRQIVDKFEEFKVRGAVHQINPGPVVTTFEFKPDRGVKYSKVTNLSEDLCLALESESILVERIPGKATVGIEVPNKNREIISLREVIDSPVFRRSRSMLSFALGKDISGKIHCADLAGMPHLLVAGQTGSGKSVMVNCVIMSILLRATPEQVRFILVDPKTVELGLYRDIPHLLTPVITDMKEATNALKNATREMERRLQLLAKYGVRNISQFNEKIERLSNRPSPKGGEPDEVEKLPFIVVIVDELADLMMLAGRQVEESIQRLAQMARAVGIHLLLATQRPSVDVITGLIKANIPARLSFLLATRVDSRTILDSMGAESLLGKGDMLFLPPGAGRVRRLHGPLVTEDEIEAVVSHWKEQASPSYENDYLESPDGDAGQSRAEGEADFQDSKYEDAVRLVLEAGKASTSTLQRRLRLGYGRAARILDAMEEEGIIGPPAGSRPRKVLKRPDWLDAPGP